MESSKGTPVSAAGRAHPALVLILLFGAAAVFVTTVLLTGPGESGVSDGEIRGGSRSSNERSEASRIPAEPSGKETAEPAPEKQRVHEVAGTEEGDEGAASASLRGIVVLPSNESVAGARVKATRVKSLNRNLAPQAFDVFETMSGPDGSFLLDRLPVGTYSLAAVHGARAGFDTAFAASYQHHPDGLMQFHEIVLLFAGRISGRVTGPDGDPIPGAFLIAEAFPAAHAETDGEGRFVIEALTLGKRDLVVTASGFAFERVESVRTGTENLEISLSKGGFIKGKVLLDREPVEGVTITCAESSQKWRIPLEARTRKDGSYTLGPLGPGGYDLAAVSERYSAPHMSSVRLSEGEEVGGIDFDLERPGSLSGRVVDAASREGVAGIWVLLHPKPEHHHCLPPGADRVKTGTDGRFLFPFVLPADYVVSMRGGHGYPAGFWKKGVSVLVSPEERREGIDFHLERGVPMVVNLSGKGGGALANAEVTLRRREHFDLGNYSFTEEDFRIRAEETAEGRYEFRGVGPGAYAVDVERRGWIPKQENVAVCEDDESMTLDIFLERCIALNGSVVDPDKRPVAGAHVWTRWNVSAITDEEGRFTLFGVPPKRAVFNVFADGYMDSRTTRRVDRDSEPLVIILKPVGNHSVAGTAKNDLEEPVQGVKISYYQSSEGNILREHVFTKEDGSFRIDGLAEGKVRLIVQSDAGHPRESDWYIQAGRTDLKIIVDRFARVKGRVVDGSGNPMPEFVVHPQTTDRRYMRSSEQNFRDGEFDLKHVPSGEIHIRAYTESGESGQSETFSVSPGGIVEGVKITLTPRGGLSGFVRDAKTSRPVPGVKIHTGVHFDWDRLLLGWSQFSTVTAEDGSFLIEKSPTGRVNVGAKHPDYCPALVENVNVVEGLTTEGVEILLRKGGAIQGLVLVEGEGKDGIRIYATLEEGGDRSAVSGKGGEYLMEHLLPGTYKLRASYTGEEDGRTSLRIENITVAEGDASRCDIEFLLGASIQGTVYVAGGPREGVYVYAKQVKSAIDSLFASSQARSMDNGFYQLRGLHPGRYEIVASYGDDESNRRLEREVDLGEGILTLDLRLGEGDECEISGTVYLNDLPIPNVRVWAERNHFTKRTDSDVDGTFRIAGLPSGELNLHASLQPNGMGGYLLLEKRVFLDEGRAVREDLHFRTGAGVVFGDVLRGGEPIPWGHVYLKRMEDSRGDVFSTYCRTRGGKYRIENLTPGRYLVVMHWIGQFIRFAELSDGQELQVDFDIQVGEGELEGVVKLPEDEAAGKAFIYLFSPGSCPFEAGGEFSEAAAAGGRRSYSGDDGSFRFGNLPADTYEVAAVLAKDGKVQKLLMKSVDLTDGGKIEIELDLTE